MERIHGWDEEKFLFDSKHWKLFLDILVTILKIIIIDNKLNKGQIERVKGDEMGNPCESTEHSTSSQDPQKKY